jgi:glutamine amidotransferase
MKIGIIDYGIGNIASVIRAFSELEKNSEIVSNPLEAYKFDKLVLPGVGGFNESSSILKTSGWFTAIQDLVGGQDTPLLGICLGMQLLATFSTEGVNLDDDISHNQGLNLIPGSVKNLRDLRCNLRIPHIGWNEIKITNRNDEMFNSIPNGTDFYFVHSYAFTPQNNIAVAATTQYDINISAAIRNGHIWGTQFHPEKSSRAGFKLLDNFIQYS